MKTNEKKIWMVQTMHYKLNDFVGSMSVFCVFSPPLPVCQLVKVGSSSNYCTCFLLPPAAVICLPAVVLLNSILLPKLLDFWIAVQDLTPCRLLLPQPHSVSCSSTSTSSFPCLPSSCPELQHPASPFSTSKGNYTSKLCVKINFCGEVLSALWIKFFGKPNRTNINKPTCLTI